MEFFLGEFILPLPGTALLDAFLPGSWPRSAQRSPISDDLNTSELSNFFISKKKITGGKETPPVASSVLPVLVARTCERPPHSEGNVRVARASHCPVRPDKPLSLSVEEGVLTLFRQRRASARSVFFFFNPFCSFSRAKK